MSERRRVSLTDKAEGFEPAEVDLWENETWGGLFLTVDVTKPVQDKLTELRAEATDAALCGTDVRHTLHHAERGHCTTAHYLRRLHGQCGIFYDRRVACHEPL